MHLRGWLSVLTCLIILVCVIAPASAQPAGPQSGVSRTWSIPWHASSLDPGAIVFRNMSIGYGGNNNYPVISYENRATYETSRLVFYRPDVGQPGTNCTPNWICTPILGDADPESFSQMDTYNFPNSFKVSWAYQQTPSLNLVLGTIQFSDDLMQLGDPIVTTIVEPDLFAGYLNGTPSFQFDEFGNAHIAFVMSVYPHTRLMYAHRTNTAATTPCNHDPGTRWQCDTIKEVTNVQEIRDTKIVIDQNNNPHIFYTYFSNVVGEYGELMLAREEPNFLKHPNCGPGGNTWRCFMLDKNQGDYLVFTDNWRPIIEMAVGPDKPHLAYTVQMTGDSLLSIRHAHYVGLGGNCGQDYILTGEGYVLRNLWRCETTTWGMNQGATTPFSNFSLQVDSQDYPVIAAPYMKDPDGWYHATLIYPSERTGAPAGSWIYQDLDGKDMDTGLWISLVLGSNDLGAVAHIADFQYEPTLRLVIQEGFPVYLPLVRR